MGEPRLKPYLHFLAATVAIVLLSACNAPRGAALQREIAAEADSTAASFQLVAMADPEIAAQVARWPATGEGLGLGWPGKGQSQPSRLLRRGDVVEVTIWDNTPNSLLTPPGQRSVTMAGLEISPEGSIYVPYVEEVPLAGKSPETARGLLQERLASIAPAAQVQLAVREGEQNTIELVSGVAKPGRYPIAAKGVTILAALAAGGGIPDEMRNAVVRLQRGGASHAALAEDLYRDPARDILLRGGDRIAVVSDPRSFVLMGATGTQKSVTFQKARHSLLEALSMGGGLQANRADLRGVMVLRLYPERGLRPGQAGAPGPQKPNVVFAFDLSTGMGLFNARKFQIHPEDVILATESPLPAAQSILGLFGTTMLSLTRVNDL